MGMFPSAAEHWVTTWLSVGISVSRPWVVLNSDEIVDLISQFNPQFSPDSAAGSSHAPPFVPLRTWDFKRCITMESVTDRMLGNSYVK
jgi:hypothetical protein